MALPRNRDSLSLLSSLLVSSQTSSMLTAQSRSAQQTTWLNARHLVEADGDGRFTFILLSLKALLRSARERRSAADVVTMSIPVSFVECERDCDADDVICREPCAAQAMIFGRG